MAQKIKNYLKINKVVFNGIKVFLVINGVIIAGIITNNYQKDTNVPQPNYSYLTSIIGEERQIAEYKEDEILEEIPIKDSQPAPVIKNDNKNITVKEKSDSSTANNAINNDYKEEKNEITSQMMVTVYRSNGSVMEISLNDYLIGVVAVEMPASFSTEALKAQALVARTYTLRLIKDGRKLTDTSSTQMYYDNNKLQSNWGSDFSTYYNKIKNAVYATDKEVIMYNNQYIDAVYHSTSNGRTSDAADVWGNNIAYLKSVDSKWDIGVSAYSKTEQKSFDIISTLLGINVKNDVNIAVVSRTSNNSIKELSIGGNIYTGIELRNLFNLRSTDFDFEINDAGMSFTTRGYGHGVGMSQYGANGMAKEGYNYSQIIKHYYTGVTISKI